MSTDKLTNAFAAKYEELKQFTDKNISYKDLPQCTYINVRGIQCNSKCLLNKDDPNPKCAKHIESIEVKRCTHVENDIQCDKLTRGKSGLCHYHSIMFYNREKAKKYYEKNKDRLNKERALAYALKRADNLMNEFQNILSTVS